MKKTISAMLLLALSSALFACESSSDSVVEQETENNREDVDTDPEDVDTNPEDVDTDPENVDTEAEKVAPTIKLTIQLPDDFDGEPQILTPYFFSTPDFSEPDQDGDFIHDPEISAGGSLSVEIPQYGLNGEYYLAMALYCKGGGEGNELVPGVDWVGAVEDPLDLNPKSGQVEAGTIEMTPFGEQ